jgi:hypothetical protein
MEWWKNGNPNIPLFQHSIIPDALDKGEAKKGQMMSPD